MRCWGRCGNAGADGLTAAMTKMCAGREWCPASGALGGGQCCTAIGAEAARSFGAAGSANSLWRKRGCHGLQPTLLARADPFNGLSQTWHHPDQTTGSEEHRESQAQVSRSVFRMVGKSARLSPLLSCRHRSPGRYRPVRRRPRDLHARPRLECVAPAPEP